MKHLLTIAAALSAFVLTNASIPGTPDFVVACDGSGDFTTVQAAVDAATAVSSPAGSTWSTDANDWTATWDGTNNPCPEGWRIPTTAEFDELWTNVGRFATNLSARKVIQYRQASSGKIVFLPYAGYRNLSDGATAVQGTGTASYYWASAPDPVGYVAVSNSTSARISTKVLKADANFACFVRCVKAE
jgi:uncharacterized protein (TIGR02145 family)